MQRRSYTSKYTLIGDTPIPAELGTTITGAIANLYVDTASVIIYSAANDTVTFTDNKGTHQVTTDSTGRSDPIQIAVSIISPITFTSSVAKNPNNLSANYTKSVAIYSTTTSVYVMPDGYIVYWYGYSPRSISISTWSGSGGQVTYAANTMIVKGTVSTSVGGAFVDNVIDLTNYSTMKDITSYTLDGLVSAYYGSCRMWSARQQSGVSEMGITQGATGSGSLMLRASALNKTSNSGYWVARFDSKDSHYPTTTIHAAWLE